MGRPKILLVDDEADLVELIKLHLEKTGYEVIAAQNGLEALEKAREEKPDLVILDVMLPKLNGYEVCTLLKQDPRYQNIPILVITARGEAEGLALAIECGAHSCLVKPIQLDVLLGRVQALVTNGAHR